MHRRGALPGLLAVCLSLALPAESVAQAEPRIYAYRLVYGELTTAQPVRGTEGFFHQHYLYDGSAGERINVSAASQEFDVAVALYPPSVQGDALADHGGAADGDKWVAFVSMTLTAPGLYVICVHSHRAGDTGEYSVYVTSSKPSGVSTAPPAASPVRRPCVAQGEAYANSADWFINNEPITVNSRTYVKYGLPRLLGAGEVKWYSAFRGTGVYVEPSASAMRPEWLYVAVRGCEFQPYQEQR